jgi:GxxExxY protein
MACEPKHLDPIGRMAVDAALKVHRELGPGLLESVYEHCLAHEIAKRGAQVRRQVPVPIIYDGVRLDAERSSTCWWTTRSLSK